MKSFVKVGAILALSVMVVSAFAQGGGGGGRGGRGGGMGQFGRGGGGVSETQLLSRKDVQTELKITADQKTKADAELQKLRDARRGAGGGGNGGGGNFRDMSEAERTKAMEERQKQQAKNAEEDLKALGTVLSKEQLTRLHELYIQRLGNGIIARPEFQKELSVTDEQKKKIAELQTQQQEAARAAFQNGGFQDMSDDERQAAMQKMQETTRKNQEIMNTKLGELMTQEQKDKVAKMGGAKFKFDPAEDNVRRGGGGGR